MAFFALEVLDGALLFPVDDCTQQLLEERSDVTRASGWGDLARSDEAGKGLDDSVVCIFRLQFLCEIKGGEMCFVKNVVWYCM